MIIFIVCPLWKNCKALLKSRLSCHLMTIFHFNRFASLAPVPSITFDHRKYAHTEHVITHRVPATNQPANQRQQRQRPDNRIPTYLLTTTSATTIYYNTPSFPLQFHNETAFHSCLRKQFTISPPEQLFRATTTIWRWNRELLSPGDRCSAHLAFKMNGAGTARGPIPAALLRIFTPIFPGTDAYKLAFP